MVGTKRAGYVYIYNHVLKKKDGYTNFLGSYTDREFWAQQKLKNESDILKERSHKKQISAFAGANTLNSQTGG